MRSLLHALVFLIAAFSNSLAADSTIYSHPFGKPSDPAIIFIHGGPGYNAYSFEESTADSLAHRGFFVVDYDQRGSGRSEITRGKFTYDEVVADLESIYDRYHLKKAALIGHSWGGLVATMFTARHPKMVREIILVSAPISLQRTLHTIMSNYGAKFSDTASEEHSEWAMINDLDPSSFQYSSGAFQLAMTGGFYRPKVQSEHAKALWAKLKVELRPDLWTLQVRALHLARLDRHTSDDRKNDPSLRYLW
jgi:proline iminopeptidase